MCIFISLSPPSSRSYFFCLQRRFKLEETGEKKFCQHLQKGDWPHQHWKWHEDKAEQNSAVQKPRLPCSSAFCHHCQHLHWEHSSSRERNEAFAGSVSTPRSGLCFQSLFLYLFQSLQQQMIVHRHQTNFTRVHPSPPGYCLSLSLALNLAACCSHCSTWLSRSVAETSSMSV